MESPTKNVTWGYLRTGGRDDWQRNIGLLIQAGASSGNIFFESEGDREFNRMLGMAKRKDAIIVLSIEDVCKTIDELFRLTEWMIKRGITFRSVGEPWFSLSAETTQGAGLYGLIGRLYDLQNRLSSPSTNNTPVRRPVGRPKGVRPEMKRKLEMALVIYQEHNELSVAEVCNLVGLNQRAFYRYLCQQDSSVVRRSRGRKPKTEISAD